MNCRLSIVVGMLLLAAGRGWSAETSPSRPSNIVFILADDLGWSDTTLYGNTKFYETPNIQRLARPALLGTGTPRDVVFNYFPHYTPATAQQPAACVRRGDWKLIRFFHDGPNQEDRVELYNLKDDIGETKNLADAQPQRVAELNRLLDDFLADTHAVIPTKNPAFDPNARAPVYDHMAHPAGPRHGTTVPSLREELEQRSDAGMPGDAPGE